jgi:Zn-dependent protease with chaperone function
VLSPVLVLATVAVGLVPAAAELATARWPRRSPAAAIMLWQAMGLGWGLAAIGTLAALGADPEGPGVAGGVLTVLDRAARNVTGEVRPPGLAAAMRLLCLGASAALLALLCWVLIASTGAVLRDRRRHRALLSLLAHGDPKVPGALVVDYPAAAAYCVPGLRSRIVISAGALDLLDQAELAAVLAHERAHLRERHDLVLLPFTALARAFPWSVLVQRSYASVALLVEMLADDHAARQRPARELVTALIRVGAAGTPAGTLAVADEDAEDESGVTARVERLLTPAPGLGLGARILVCSTAAALVVVPAALLVMPLSAASFNSGAR